MQVVLLYKFLEYVLAFSVLFFSSKANSYDCGQSETEDRLLSSKNATDTQWPWMVAILDRSKPENKQYLCNGFLIDRRHVLSVAHCFENKIVKNKKMLSARIGSANFEKGEEYSIADITLHEKYKSGFFYGDIAMLTLNRDVDIPNFNPVCLPGAQLSSENLNGLSAVVVGWGTEKLFGATSNNLQQYSGVTIAPNPECSLALQKVMKTTFNRQFPRGVNLAYICAIYTGKARDACGILSGGPLMIYEKNRWFAVGFVSFGMSCSQSEIPMGFVRISHYLNWINDVTGD